MFVTMGEIHIWEEEISIPFRDFVCSLFERLVAVMERLLSYPDLARPTSHFLSTWTLAKHGQRFLGGPILTSISVGQQPNV